MPFEVYKSRVKIVRDEEVVKKWVDDQSWKTEYVCLNLPEPLRLDSMDAVEKHFRETHKENIIKPVETHTLTGAAARALRSPELVRLVRSVWEDQRRFPLQIATVLSQQFAAPWPPVLQGQQDRHPRFRRPAALPGSGRDARCPKGSSASSITSTRIPRATAAS